VADINKNTVNQMYKYKLFDSIIVPALSEILRLNLLHPKLVSILPIHFRKIFTGFTINPIVFTVGFKEDLTTFLFLKIDEKFNDIHDFAYLQLRNIT
jgi:hypothetical protein